MQPTSQCSSRLLRVQPETNRSGSRFSCAILGDQFSLSELQLPHSLLGSVSRKQEVPALLIFVEELQSIGAGKNFCPFPAGMKHREVMWKAPDHTAGKRSRLSRRSLQRASILALPGLEEAACRLLTQAEERKAERLISAGWNRRGSVRVGCRGEAGGRGELKMLHKEGVGREGPF